MKGKKQIMKNKTIRIALALILALGVLFSATSCADESWSYKDDQNTLSIGSYIYFTFNAYSYAMQQLDTELQQQLASDPSSPTEETTPESVFTKDIVDYDGNTVNVYDFILSEGDLGCKNLLNVSKMFDDLGLTITDEEMASIESAANSTWSAYGSSYESLGISKDTFLTVEYIYATKYEEVFKTLYGEGGEKEVTVDELKEHFTENFTNYAYFPIQLYTSTTNDDGTVSYEALPEDEVEEITTALEDYAKQINDGTITYEEFAEEYTKELDLAQDPTVSGNEILEDSSMGQDIKDELEELKSNNASYITIGEDESAVAYFVFKGDIEHEAEENFDESLEYYVLQTLKLEEYNNSLIDAAKNYTCTVNEAAIEKYNPYKLLPQG